jgi:hypothetical protein
MARSDPVKDCVKEFMLEQGFHLEASPYNRIKWWARETGAVIWFVHLWHIQDRLGALWARVKDGDTGRRELDQIMDLRNEMPDDIRKSVIRSALEEAGMPFLRSCDTIEHAKAALSNLRYLFSSRVQELI